MNNKVLVILIIIFHTTLSAFESLIFHRAFSTLSNPTHYKFSPTGHYVVITNQSSFDIHDAYTGKIMGAYQFSTIEGNYINSISFSKTGMLVGIGYNSDNSIGYKTIVTNISNLQTTTEFYQEVSDISNSKNDSYEVRDTCFIKDDIFIDIQDEGIITVTDLRQGSSKFIFQEYDFMAIEVVNHDENRVVVAAEEYDNRELLLIFFEYSPERQGMQIVDKYTITEENLTLITDLEITDDQFRLFIVGDTPTIYYYEFIGRMIWRFPLQKPIFSDNGFLSIEVSTDQRKMLVFNETHLEMITLQSHQLSMISQAIQVPSASMSKVSANLIFMNPSQQSINVGLCQEDEYLYDEDGLKCFKCKQNCTTCSDSKVGLQCFSCNQSFYLKNRSCEKCRPYCQSCLSFDFCSQCKENFVVNGSDCVCQTGRYIDDQKCINCPKGCVLCTSADNCSRCEPGYYHETQLCMKCPQNCTSCSSQEKCLSCIAEFILLDGKCTQNQEPSGGSKAWIFIVLGMVAILVIGGGLIAYRKFKIKKATRLSQMSSSSYSELQ